MKVEKRDGKFTQMKFDNVVNRMKNLITPEMKKMFKPTSSHRRSFRASTMA